MPLDIDNLLKPISDESPCGEDVADDAKFFVLEQAARGTEANQFAEGSEPDWKEVKSVALELFESGKSLQVAIYLCLGALKQDGIAGFADALDVLKHLIEDFWDTVHPELDPDDDNDPTQRINTIGCISPAEGSFEDTMRFRDHFLDAHVVNSTQVGRFSTRDILIAQGELSASEDATDLANSQLINAAFQDAAEDDLLESQSLLTRCKELVSGIDEALANKVGASNSISFHALLDTVTLSLKKVSEYMDARGIGEAPDDEDASGDTESTGGSGGGGARPSGDIQSSADVLSMLDKIMKYYQINEPASPVPLVLNRARGLVGRDFLEILKDLAPDAIGDVEKVSGKLDEASEESW